MLTLRFTTRPQPYEWPRFVKLKFIILSSLLYSFNDLAELQEEVPKSTCGLARATSVLSSCMNVAKEITRSMPTFVTSGPVRIKSPFLNTEKNVRHLLFGLFAFLDIYV